MKVEYKDTAGTWLVAVDGDLTWDVHKDETVWSLVPGDHIHVRVTVLSFLAHLSR